MWSFKSRVIETIDAHQVVILCGETGWYVTSLFLFVYKQVLTPT